MTIYHNNKEVTVKGLAKLAHKKYPDVTVFEFKEPAKRVIDMCFMKGINLLQLTDDTKSKLVWDKYWQMQYEVKE